MQVDPMSQDCPISKMIELGFVKTTRGDWHHATLPIIVVRARGTHYRRPWYAKRIRPAPTILLLATSEQRKEKLRTFASPASCAKAALAHWR